MNTSEFLEQVITTERGNLLIAVRNHTIPWHENFYVYPDQLSQALSHIESLKPTSDVYFTSHLFNEPVSSKELVLPSRTIQADLDYARDYPIEPSILVRTSPNRYQGYWLLKYECEQELLESISKRLTYAINDSDHAGWSLGHRVRLPGTLNFKYTSGPQPIEIVSESLTLYSPEEFEFLPEIKPISNGIFDNDFVANADQINLGVGPLEFITQMKDRLNSSLYYEYVSKTVAEDRSSWLWSLMCTLFEAGLPRDEVFWLAKHSPNNKFAADLRYNANQELAKDVLRAEQHVKVKPVDLISTIDRARTMAIQNVPGGALIKQRHILFTVRFAMEQLGKFVKVIAGLPYYIPKDTGRPIALTAGSEYYRALLSTKYGISSADAIYKMVHDGIIDHVLETAPEMHESSFSWFDGQTLLVHTGTRDVVKVTADGYSMTNTTDCGIVFPWHDTFEPFKLPHEPYEGDWAEAVFGDLHNTANMMPQEAKALLKSWLIFSLFRSQLSTRPILAFFGPPISSKSTIPHRIYSLFYASRLAVSGVTGAKDFDDASARYPIYCIDNLDTYVNWIIDKLAQAISNADVTTRKLFTDVEMIRKRRNAMLIVTAHNPRFTREDVTSRLLLITLSPIEPSRLKNETEYYQHIIHNRPALWLSIIKDVVKVLQTPRPLTSTVKWRIEDFALYGEWIADALGYKEDFISGMSALLTAQADIILHQEELLTTVLTETEVENITVTDLWNMLLMQLGGNAAAFIQRYKTPLYLQQKLITMQPSLKKIINIECSVDPTLRTRRWTIHGKYPSKLAEYHISTHSENS